MRHSFLVFILLFVVIAGCNKEDNLDQGFLLFKETGCANPWGATKDVNEIKDYLESEGLHLLEIKRKENSEYSEVQYCEACTCLTGAVILIKVDYDDSFKALGLGFTTLNGEVICG